MRLSNAASCGDPELCLEGTDWRLDEGAKPASDAALRLGERKPEDEDEAHDRRHAEDADHDRLRDH